MVANVMTVGYVHFDQEIVEGVVVMLVMVSMMYLVMAMRNSVLPVIRMVL